MTKLTLSPVPEVVTKLVTTATSRPRLALDQRGGSNTTGFWIQVPQCKNQRRNRVGISFLSMKLSAHPGSDVTVHHVHNNTFSRFHDSGRFNFPRRSQIRSCPGPNSPTCFQLELARDHVKPSVPDLFITVVTAVVAAPISRSGPAWEA
ncbi:hypothetical protein EVAR_60281_1 [Eumeta japonica]|uniref:Uncharacterized protein n=1 Tax=Eumeta variegata TaxID=151549 RepID=A0A4C1Z786_EUMVA|nr:hypothetical protein EVAR_60281_1 [Eumeta japonica]